MTFCKKLLLLKWIVASTTATFEATDISTVGAAGGCKTVDGRDCVFPFTFLGQSYSYCTTAQSMNGAAWCATKVDSAGTVVNNMWEDCKPECPRNDGTGEGELLFISDSFFVWNEFDPPPFSVKISTCLNPCLANNQQAVSKQFAGVRKHFLSS